MRCIGSDLLRALILERARGPKQQLGLSSAVTFIPAKVKGTMSTN